MSTILGRRRLAAVAVMTLVWMSGPAGGADALPTDNPTAAYHLDWTDQIRWSNVVDIQDFQGKDWDEKVDAAQQALAQKGGGAIYFPPGVYEFRRTIKLRSGTVLRGAAPTGTADARDAGYALPTKINFPQYRPTFTGEGTPNSSAFQGIELAEPAGVSNCGAAHLAINHGHIDLSDADFEKTFADGKCGTNRIVFGCTLRNAALLDASIPTLKDALGRPFQDAWQRWTQRHHAAIHVYAGGNVLVGNCRIPESGEDNFIMKGYKLYPQTKEGEFSKQLAKLAVQTCDVPFDYDNRGGIFVNSLGAGKALNIWNLFGATGNMQANLEPSAAAAAAAEAAAEPIRARPWAFAKGIVIRNNYVFCTGAGAIKFTGDGTVCSFNVIRYKPDVVRPTARGYQLDSFTNNNRAIEMRGYRWTVEGNDYEVHSNLSLQGHRYGDGEGLMHEAYDNCDIRGCKLLGNKGNRYLCIWRVPVDGLEIRGNVVAGGINVLGATNLSVPLPVKNVKILANTTIDSGISITGRPAESNAIKDNKFQSAADGRAASKYPGGLNKNQIINESLAVLENNQGYEEITRDPPPPKRPKTPPVAPVRKPAP